MEELAGKIADLLNDPEISKQIKSITNQKNFENEKNGEKESSDSVFSGLSPEILNAVMKLVPLMASINTKDKYTDLLNALRPLLGPPRQKKLDEAAKFIKFLKILPILKQQGIL